MNIVWDDNRKIWTHCVKAGFYDTDAISCMLVLIHKQNKQFAPAPLIFLLFSLMQVPCVHFLLVLSLNSLFTTSLQSFVSLFPLSSFLWHFFHTFSYHIISPWLSYIHTSFLPSTYLLPSTTISLFNLMFLWFYAVTHCRVICIHTWHVNKSPLIKIWPHLLEPVSEPGTHTVVGICCWRNAPPWRKVSEWASGSRASLNVQWV